MITPRIVYIVSDTEKSLEFEWVANYFVNRTNIHFLLIGRKETPLASYLASIGMPCEFITDEDASSMAAKVLRVVRILKRLRPTVVHCHLWRASLVGLTASYLTSVKKRIFTRHHSMIHYREFKSGRKWDKLCNWLATDIVAISDNVKNVLINFDGAQETKIHVIHHGFDLAYFERVSEDQLLKVRTRYNVSPQKPIIGVISRYLELKGIQYIIPAFQQLIKDFPSAHLILANARGPYQIEIKKRLQDLPNTSYTEIEFEEDLAALYKLFDIFVHTPVDLQQEAFGQTYVEALASGVPSVFTLSGVAPEFIVHEKNALVVPYRDSTSIHNAFVSILTDVGLKHRLIENGKKSATLFRIERMMTSLETLYDITNHS